MILSFKNIFRNQLEHYIRKLFRMRSNVKVKIYHKLRNITFLILLELFQIHIIGNALPYVSIPG